MLTSPYGGYTYQHMPPPSGGGGGSGSSGSGTGSTGGSGGSSGSSGGSDGIALMSCPNSFSNPQGWLVCEMGNAFIQLYNNASPVFKDVFGYVANPIKGAVSNIPSDFANNKTISSMISDVENVPSKLDDLKSKLGNIQSDLSSMPKDIANGLGTVFMNGLKSIGITKANLDSLGSALNYLFGHLKSAFQDMISALKTIPKDAKHLGNFFLNFGSNIKTYINKIWNGLIGHFKSLWKNDITPFFKSLYNNHISPALTYVKKHYLNPFINKVKSFTSDATTFFTDITGGLGTIQVSGIRAYHFLTDETFGVPNWAWIGIGATTATIGVAATTVYAKGALIQLGKKSVG